MMNASQSLQPEHIPGHAAKTLLSLAFVFLITLLNTGPSTAQRRDPSPSRATGFTLFGDFEVDEKEADEHKPISFTLILYMRGGNIFDRQTIGSKGRYRFLNVPAGQYELSVEVEGTEITRLSIMIVEGQLITDIRQDISLGWKRPAGSSTFPSPDAGEPYIGSRANADRFEKAIKAKNKKDYAQAISLLQEIVGNDPRDFQAWTELGNIHFLQKSFADAENEYLRAIDAHPGSFLALFNLGRLEISQKKYEVAVEVLAGAVKARPESPDANYFLGEAYLQIRKGSLAVVYFKEALRLDPQGMAEVHLRLAALYKAAGIKDKAAAEYEEFLKKRPNYADRKKLEQYIVDNKKH